MEPIKYYKDDRYDYDLYEYFERTINVQNEDGVWTTNFDPMGNGYNHLGYDTLTLINMVYEGTKMKMRYYFIDDEGDMNRMDEDEFNFITWKGAYRTTPMTPEEHQEVARVKHLLSLTIEERNEIEEPKKTNLINNFTFLRS